MTAILHTKLHIPRQRRNNVRRPRLVERLNSKTSQTITLISAPAGFGKTTLLAEWIPTSEGCVTWTSLDEGDNDPVRFWGAFLAALQRLDADLGQSAAKMLESPQAPPIEALLALVINEIGACPLSFVHVFDDYHFIDNHAIDEALTWLLEHLPPNLKIIIASRADPALPLARWRGRGQLAEIRASDLRFTGEEVTAFLIGQMRLGLSAAQIAALEARTEGWIAGLQLAGLSLQGRQDVAGFVATFTGSHHYIVDYLVEEVLQRQPADIQSFLLQTSILEQLSGPLCEALTGRADSQSVMEQLERQNLFLHPLDHERGWYRYHHLFADVLQAHLRQNQPALWAELHQRAVAWYSDQGLLEAAVRHALAGGDPEQAARLIEQVAGEMLRQGASATLIRWLAAVPETVVRARPRLCLARGWTLVWGAVINLDGADECVQLARQAALADPVGAAETAGEIAALQALIAATRNEMARSRELALQALEDLPSDSAWRGVVALCLGTAYSASGDLAAAAQAFGEVLRLSQAGGMHFVQVTAASFLADLLVFQGQLGRAQAMYEQVLAWVDPGLPQKGGVMARGGLAHILYERNQLEAALTHIQAGVGQLAQVGGAYGAFVLNRVLARIQQAQGNGKDALDALERSHQLGQAAKVGLVVAQASAWRARLQLAQGDLGSAAAWATHSGLTATDAAASHPGWREIEFLTLARVLEAEGKQIEALAVLDRLIEAALAEGRNGSAISILAFQACAKHAQGQTTHALACLEQALALGEPEGYVRSFVDEGAPIRALLGQVTGERQPYAQRLLAAFELGGTQVNAPALHGAARTPPAPAASSQLLEPLRDRELEVLRLMAEGCSNHEIAARLVLGKSTVKTHINHLFQKLAVTSRTQAIARGRALGLLVS